MWCSDLFDKGLPELHHGQKQIYYAAILELFEGLSTQLKNIKPNQPKLYYLELLGRDSRHQGKQAGSGMKDDGMLPEIGAISIRNCNIELSLVVLLRNTSVHKFRSFLSEI